MCAASVPGHAQADEVSRTTEELDREFEHIFRSIETSAPARERTRTKQAKPRIGSQLEEEWESIARDLAKEKVSTYADRICEMRILSRVQLHPDAPLKSVAAAAAKAVPLMDPPSKDTPQAPFGGEADDPVESSGRDNLQCKGSIVSSVMRRVRVKLLAARALASIVTDLNKGVIEDLDVGAGGSRESAGAPMK